MGIQINSIGTGTIVDWAYEDTPGLSIQPGAIPGRPEPGALLFGMALIGVSVLRRRRSARTAWPCHAFAQDTVSIRASCAICLIA